MVPNEVFNCIIEYLEIQDLNKISLLNKKCKDLCDDFVQRQFLKLLRKNDILIRNEYIDPLNTFTKKLYKNIILYVNLKYSDVFCRGSLIIINLSRASKTYIEFKTMKYHNRYFFLIDDSIYNSIQCENLTNAITHTTIANKPIKLYPNLNLRDRNFIQLHRVNYKDTYNTRNKGTQIATNMMSFYFLLN